jgi:hypothetical protein
MYHPIINENRFWSLLASQIEIMVKIILRASVFVNIWRSWKIFEIIIIPCKLFEFSN